MARKIETLFVAGPAGRLEALLEEPEDRDPIAIAVICHPHPLFGGTMHNKVVYRMARGLRRSGHVVLRFNFRGVNMSEGAHGEGVGEVDDACAAHALLSERYPGLPCTLAGFSFGARVCLWLAHDEGIATRVIAVGYPAHYPDAAGVAEQMPRVFIHSRNDAICLPGLLQQVYDSLGGEKSLHWIDAKDHFFTGALQELEDLIAGLQ